MDRLDSVAVALERAEMDRRTRADALDCENAAEHERIRARTERLEAVSAAARSAGLRVHLDEYKVLLIANGWAHPALIARYSWEPTPPAWIVTVGVVVNRARTTLESVEEFLDEWETLIATADAERRTADREHRRPSWKPCAPPGGRGERVGPVPV